MEADTELELNSLVKLLWRGRLLIVLAAVLWSTSGLFAKAPIFEGWPTESRGVLFAFWRALFAAAVLLLMVRKVQWSWKLIPLSTVFAAMNWTFLNSLVYCESTLAIWLQYTAPAWVFLVGWKVFKDQPGWRDWALLGFAALGVSIILQAELYGASPIGVQFGLASGLCFAGVVLMLRWLQDFDSAWLIFLNHAVTAILFLPAMLSLQVYPSPTQSAYLLGFGALQMGLPYVIFARAVRWVPSHEASALTLLEPLLVPLWVFLAWRTAPDYQPPAFTTIIGGSFILAGLLIRYSRSRKRGSS